MTATTVHRYAIAPADGGGCSVTYRATITRYDGFPPVVGWPVIGRWLLASSAKYMRKGFVGLIALAEERAGSR